ncbi:MAG: IS66 family transposase [Legionellaceae bacterium]|nr:IS66 family transposase [Legionellaceae bacterium]
MNAATILNFPERSLLDSPKQTLVLMIVALRAELECVRTESTQTIADLQEKLALRDAELEKLTKANINNTVNQPSSKQPEFNKDTGVDPNKKKKRKKKRTGRVGAGNRAKPAPDIVNQNPLIACPDCQTDLTAQPVVESQSRIVEDIPPIPEKTIVSEEIQERKWCPTCAKVVASVSEAALPRSDIGLRSLCLVAYLWVVSAISLPGIAAFLNSFFRLRVSTAGLSRMMIRLGNIMAPIHDEILNDVKGGSIIFADETGWRVKGVLWWLWIFANKRSAYYWPDRKRSGAVVAQLLGDLFSGVLVTDAWYAYMKIICAKQTCMAHILRKIRKFRDAYPEHYCIVQLHQKLRRILADGERLQLARKEIGEEVFMRRLALLKVRLQKLLDWPEPNDILKDIIAKVARQQPYILTFVEHEGVPNHNNYGEYIIKKGILKRKVSGGSMSEEGVTAYAVLQSIAQTCHLRGLSFTGFLTASLLHYIRTGIPLLLSQYELQITNKQAQKEAA